MKTLNFELSKRLNDLKLLKNIETEYFYYKPYKDKNKWHIGPNSIVYGIDRGDIKTLTLEEALEYIPDCIQITKHDNCEDKYLIDYNTDDNCESFSGKTLLEAIESMIEYLLDNNLLTKETIGKQQ